MHFSFHVTFLGNGANLHKIKETARRLSQRLYMFAPFNGLLDHSAAQLAYAEEIALYVPLHAV